MLHLHKLYFYFEPHTSNVRIVTVLLIPILLYFLSYYTTWAEYTVEDYERSMTIEGFLDLDEIPFLMAFIQVQKVLKILPI